MKKGLFPILCASLCTVVAFKAFAANFSQTATYTEGQFPDVSATEWYSAEVGNAYELGLMNGKGNGIFAPDSSVTVAEAITMAARTAAIYAGEEIGAAAAGEVWYAPYVAYAEAKGFVTDGQFDSEDFGRPAKRYETALLFAKALPAEYFAAQNTVSTIPDVSFTAPYFDELLMLYNAGVVMGSDEYGTFNPQAPITRAEAAAIIGRVALPEKRLVKTLTAKSSPEAYYLIDAKNMAAGRNGLANGWLYDNKSQLFNTSGRDINVILDTSDIHYSALYRDFDPESDGLLTLEMYVSARAENEGVYIGFAAEDESIAFSLKVKDGSWVLAGLDERRTPITVPTENAAEYAIVLYADLDAHTVSATINNVPCGEVAIPALPICRLVVGSTKEGIGRIEPHQVRLTKNYVCAEHFAAVDALEGVVPCGMEVEGNVTVRKILSVAGSDLFSAHIDADAGSRNSVFKTFSPVVGKGVFETYVLLPEKRDGAYFALYNGEDELLRIETKNGSWYVGDTKLRDYTANIWQSLRIDTDPALGTATVKVCGKAVAEVPFEVSYADGIAVGFAPSQDGVMWFDDITAYAFVDHADYPAEPVVAESKDYNIGVHVCNLWRDSHSGEGWDSSAPFDELEPYLGFYEEGTPELADWEIKMMVEHGIDFQHLCWYAPYTELTAPVKIPNVSGAALHDGFMNARYSNLMTFCIMWENNNGHVKSLDAFKEYLWNYWKEYYFSDPRYTVLDNCPVLTVWSYSKFISSFGDVEKAKEAIAFMREDIKTLGYDNIILLFADGHQMTKSFFDNILALGADGTYPYHFNRTGIDPDHQIYRMSTQIGFQSVHTVPAVSVGFNDIGRNENRTGLITPENHKKVCEYIRDTALPTYNTGTWKDNTFFVSTWNEYSEGTYVCPSNIYGYAYLENIREVFTDSTGDHSAADVMPTDAQKARLTHMYPDSHQPIRWYKFEESDIDTSDTTVEKLKAVKTWDFSDSAAKTDWKHQFGISDYDDSGDVIKGSSTGFDYAICNTADLNIDIGDIPYIHLRLKTSSAANFEIFYITADDTTWDGNKYVKTAITAANEFVDYYVDMTDSYKWRGTLKKLRIDPLTVAGSFEISLIELMTIDDSVIVEDTTPTVKVNTRTMAFNFRPVLLADGDMAVTADPRKGFFTQLQLYHEWNRFTGVLMVESEEHRLYFTLGSDTVLLDGETVPLGFTFRLRDGLPVLEIKKFCELLGYKAHAEKNVIDIQCVSDEEYQAILNRKENEWEFESDEDTEGFSAQNGLLTVKDGFINLTATNADPAFVSPTLNFKASKYTKLVVGIVADKSIMQGQWMQFFFTKTSSTAMSEDKSYKHYYDTGAMTDGEIYEVTFNLGDCELWSSYITKIRIDPFNKKETATVAYIRFVE